MNLIRKRNKVILVLVILGIFYILFLPSPTPEFAVRKFLFTINPIKAVFSSVEPGKIKNDVLYGDLYYAEKFTSPYIYVKKNSIGWYVTGSGTGP